MAESEQGWKRNSWLGKTISYQREHCIIINTENGWLIVGKDDGWRSPERYAFAKQAKLAASERYGG